MIVVPPIGAAEPKAKTRAKVTGPGGGGGSRPGSSTNVHPPPVVVAPPGIPGGNVVVPLPPLDPHDAEEFWFLANLLVLFSGMLKSGSNS